MAITLIKPRCTIVSSHFVKQICWCCRISVFCDEVFFFCFCYFFLPFLLHIFVIITYFGLFYVEVLGLIDLHHVLTVIIVCNISSIICAQKQ